MANRQLDVVVRVNQLTHFGRVLRAQVLKDENEIVRRATFKTRKQAQDLVLKRFEAKTKWSRQSVYATIYDKYPHEPAVGRVAMSLRKWGKLRWPIDGGIRTADSIEDAGEFVLVRTEGRGRSGSTKLFDFARRVARDEPVHREKFGGRSRGGLVSVPLRKNPDHRLVLRTTSRVRGRGDDRREREYGRRIGYLVPKATYPQRVPFDRAIRTLAIRNLHTTTRKVFGRTRVKMPR